MAPKRLLLVKQTPSQKHIVCVPASLNPYGSQLVGESLEQDPDAFIGKLFEIRKSVFVEEQGVPLEAELDAYDDSAIHLGVLVPDLEVVATARILFPDYGAGRIAKIGRVAVRHDQRGTGLGKVVMELAHQVLEQLDINESVLDAQVSVVEFYRKLGYLAEGEIFMDAGIEHLKMRRCRH